MKKILLIPTLLTIACTPLISMVGCGNPDKPEPEPEVIGDCLKATALEESTFRVICTDASEAPPDLSYSTNDGKTWKNYVMPTAEEETGEEIPLHINQTLLFRGNNPTGFYDCNLGNKYRASFLFTGKISLSGNIMSLIDNGKCITSDIPCQRCFGRLFAVEGFDDTEPYRYSITSAENLILPDEDLSNCDGCYYRLFEYCCSLEIAPKLPATTLSYECYYEMFQRCKSLKEIKLSYVGNFGTSSFEKWVADVPSTGTFYYNGTDTTRGTSAIPTGWTITPF